MADDDAWSLVRLGDPADVKIALDLIEGTMLPSGPLLESAMLPVIQRHIDRTLDVETLALVLALVQVGAYCARSWAAAKGHTDVDAQSLAALELTRHMRMHQQADADLASLDERFPFPMDGTT